MGSFIIRIERHINDVRMKKKILFLFLFGILLPIVVLVVFFSYQIKSELSHREDTLVESELTRIQINIGTMVDTANNLASTYFSNKDLAWALETYSDESKDSLSVIRKIDSQILSHQMVQPFIQRINIYYENNHLFETTYAHLLNSEILQTDWYIEYAAGQQSTFLGIQDLQDSSNIYLIRKLNLLRFESNNFIKIDLSSDIIRSHFSSELLAKENSGIYLVDDDGQIALSNSSDYPKMFESVLTTSRNHLYEKSFDDNSLLSGWKLKVISDRGILYSTLSNKFLFLVLTFLVILLISMMLFYGLARTIISRLEHIAKVMEQSKNDELTEIDIEMGADEIGITAMRYNSMIQRIQCLMEDNVKANDELQSTNEELIASIEDIENKEKQIFELVYKDKLTDLDNRYAITHFIDNHILHMNAYDKFAIGFLDIDNFKLINDTYGHDIGDEIIKKTGSILNRFANDSVRIGRFGGDEFIITVKGYQDLDQVNSIHENIRLALKENIKINEISFSLTISMGVSLYGVHSKSRHELIKLADIALYKAKELGRDQIILFENTMNDALSEKLVRQAVIREAIKENQFILHYQPYYDIKTNEMNGCEALIRWKNTCYLPMSPQEVIHYIEEMGLMIEFGTWILTEACLFSKKINENRTNPLVVSINISALQLMHNNFVEKVLDIIETNQINIKHICLEMTESILMYSIEKGTSLTHRLRSAGLSISLDDFGTGYSSLKYFKELPITTLKIDKSFIDHIAINEYDEQLVDTMVQLAHNKKIKVIAEGVETLVQLNRLNKMNCDMVQGYFYSKPISEADFLIQSIEGKRRDFQ